jgi:GNAT superfamily N-acetyltransferase
VDRQRALELQRRGIEAWIRVCAEISEGGELIECDGVVAAVTPAARHRSIASSALHRGAGALERALPALAEVYDRADVAAAMWTIEPDAEADRLLEAAGYSLDGEPAAMVAELGELPRHDLEGLDWDAEATPEEVGRVNDLAYGHPPGEGISGAIGAPPVSLNPISYRAREGGEVAAVLQTVDVGTDMLVTWVATLPEHRGKGLASRLLSAALEAGRERGLETTSLQASMLGRGVYERLGYETVAPLRLHERRVVSAA